MLPLNRWGIQGPKVKVIYKMSNSQVGVRGNLGSELLMRKIKDRLNCSVSDTRTQSCGKGAKCIVGVLLARRQKSGPVDSNWVGTPTHLQKGQELCPFWACFPNLATPSLPKARDHKLEIHDSNLLGQCNIVEKFYYIPILKHHIWHKNPAT